MATRLDLDDIDHHILDRLRANAREPAATIAQHVRLSAAAVRRRIAQLESARVISAYTVVINQDLLDTSIEAYIELSFAGNTDVHAILGAAVARPEVREAMTIAGDSDALVRLRVRDLAALREAVTALRTMGPVTSSKTKIVIGRWWHAGEDLATSGASVQRNQGG